MITHKPLDLSPSNEPRIITITEDGEYHGTFVGRGDQTNSLKLTFLHKKPEIKSKVTIKAVLYDASSFDLEALLKISKGAYQTDTYLKIDCLIVGNQAKARAVPSLEIEEDQVKAGHGATVGRINQEQTHYLMTRGLKKRAAEELIIEAFLGNVTKM